MPNIEDCAKLFQDRELEQLRSENTLLKAQLQSAHMMLTDPYWNAVMLVIDHHKEQGFESADIIESSLSEVITDEWVLDRFEYVDYTPIISMLVTLGYDVLESKNDSYPISVYWDPSWSKEKYIKVYPKIREGSTILHYAPRS